MKEAERERLAAAAAVEEAARLEDKEKVNVIIVVLECLFRISNIGMRIRMNENSFIRQ